EIVIDHALAGARALGDGIDSGAAIALLRELAGGDLDDIALGAFRVVDPGTSPALAPRLSRHRRTIATAAKSGPVIFRFLTLGPNDPFLGIFRCILAGGQVPVQGRQ